MVSCLSRAAYTGQFGAWDHAGLKALEIPFNGVLRRIAGFRPTTHLLYMAPTQGGIGFTSLYDYIRHRKWNLVHRTLPASATSALAMGGLLSRAAGLGGYPWGVHSITSRTLCFFTLLRLIPGIFLATDTYARLCVGAY